MSYISKMLYQNTTLLIFKIYCKDEYLTFQALLIFQKKVFEELQTFLIYLHHHVLAIKNAKKLNFFLVGYVMDILNNQNSFKFKILTVIHLFYTGS